MADSVTPWVEINVTHTLASAEMRLPRFPNSQTPMHTHLTCLKTNIPSYTEEPLQRVGASAGLKGGEPPPLQVPLCTAPLVKQEHDIIDYFCKGSDVIPTSCDRYWLLTSCGGNDVTF